MIIKNSELKIQNWRSLFAGTLALTLVLFAGCASDSDSSSSESVAVEDPVEIIDSGEAQWKEIEGGRYLAVPYYYQKEVPLYGNAACGPTSMKMVLEYLKNVGRVEGDIPSISEMIFEVEVSESLFGDSNVDKHFIKGWGMTDVAMKRMTGLFGLENVKIIGESFHPDYPPSEAIDPLNEKEIMNTDDWEAPIDEEGWNTEKLKEEVEKGNPVIVDVTVGMDPLGGKGSPNSYAPFHSEDGEKHWELATGKGHFMVVIGFKDWETENPKVILLDPLNRGGGSDHISIYSKNVFEDSWKLLNNQGLVIK